MTSGSGRTSLTTKMQVFDVPVLEMTDVVKHYGGVRALVGASLSLDAGEVHGLVGPNGSGKSTLNRVLAGTVEPDSATILFDGKPISIGSPMDAHRHGIAAVYQQLSLIPELTVGQNLILGVERTRAGFLSTAPARSSVAAVLDRFAPALGRGVNARTKVADLSTGEQEVIEIAKAILKRPRILVLDEATASLHRDQVGLVFEIVREICREGTSVVFVSHRLNEIMEICTRATILRSGETVATVPIASTTEANLVRLMVGEIAALAAKNTSLPAGSTVLLEVVGLSGGAIHDVSFTARAGEVVGLGGMQGQGQSELLLTLFGALKAHSGAVRVRGQQRRIRSCRDAAMAGFALVPGDRGTQGMFAQRSIQENISIVSLAARAWLGFVLSPRRERTAAQKMVDRLRITIGALGDPVSALSGGNQQKVIIAKWLLDEPTIILLDDPTKGVDISAKAEIYGIIRQMTTAGATVVFNSSDDRELAAIADRVLVLYEGTIRRELSGEQVSYDSLLSSAMLIGTADHQAVDRDIRAPSGPPGAR